MLIQIGQVFGRLEVTAFEGASKYGRRWKCRCECGNEVTVPTKMLRSGHTSSCGCSRRKLPHAYKAEYSVWWGIKQRCENPAASSYHRYGGRGIRLSSNWQSFEKFIDDMGPRPSCDHTIDRLDNDGNYEFGNCAWTTKKVNARNRSTCRRVAYGGATLSLVEWADRTGISVHVLTDRLNRNWSIEKAMTKPVRHRNAKEVA